MEHSPSDTFVSQRGGHRPGLKDAIAIARRSVSGITDQKIDAVSHCQKQDGGVWHVIVDVITNSNYREAESLLTQGGYTEFVSLREIDTSAKPTMNLYGVVRVPHAFLIDRTGVIRFNGHLSSLQEETIEAWL